MLHYPSAWNSTGKPHLLGWFGTAVLQRAPRWLQVQEHVQTYHVHEEKWGAKIKGESHWGEKLLQSAVALVAKISQPKPFGPQTDSTLSQAELQSWCDFGSAQRWICPLRPSGCWVWKNRFWHGSFGGFAGRAFFNWRCATSFHSNL